MSVNGWYHTFNPSSRNTTSTQSSKNAYDSANAIPATSEPAAYNEYVTVFPGSTNIAHHR